MTFDINNLFKVFRNIDLTQENTIIFSWMQKCVIECSLVISSEI